MVSISCCKVGASPAPSCTTSTCLAFLISFYEFEQSVDGIRF